MVYKITLSISGDSFKSKEAESKNSNFHIVDQFEATDLTNESSKRSYGYGGISLWHPKKFSLQEHIKDYESWYINFIHENAKKYTLLGAEDFELYYEVYSDGEQCNFSILNPEAIKQLSKLNLNLPISTYVLTKEELEKWSRDIEKDWTRVLL